MSVVNYLLIGLLGAMLGIALYTSKMSISQGNQPTGAAAGLTAA